MLTTLLPTAPTTSGGGAGGGALGVVVPLIFLLLGLVAVTVGVLLAVRAVRATAGRRRLAREGTPARGVVVDVQINRRARGEDAAASTYRPVVSFTTGDGRRVETVAGPSATGRWVERTPVRLVHAVDDPTRAVVLEPLAGEVAEPSVARAVALGGVLVLLGAAVAATAAGGLTG